MDPLLLRRVRRLLLAWFRSHKRDLPWRHDRDPYRIWVSEVMLQQTQVATVVPYYERFLRRFPDIDTLAAADEHEVLRHWEGLGYYRRARNLHRAAKILSETTGGSLPDDPEIVGNLPGIGRYTLGAILSQAFNRSLPIVEANSQRVLCRFFGVAEDPSRGPTRQNLWRLAESILPAKSSGDFNQALMELGALVCTSVAPRCAACPLSPDCTARRRGLQDKIPHRSRRPEIESVREVAVVVHRGKKVLLAQRSGTGRWGGMWEFPHGPLADAEQHEAGASRVLRELAGVEARLGRELLTIRHAVTRFRITLVCFESHYCRGEFRSPLYVAGEWVEPTDLASYAASAPQRRLIRHLTEHGRPQLLF